MAGSSASSASISSISASISGSSSGGASASRAYREVVLIATAAAVEAGATSSEILRSVTMVASEHGLTDWESQSSTYYAIGRGLRHAGSAEAEVAALAPELAGNNPGSMKMILAGYRA
jgi:hypothetical protein